MNSPQFNAIDTFRPSQPVVDCAHALAAAVIAQAGRTGPIVISLKGIRGVSSAYFNALLLKLFAAFGRDAIAERLEFQTDSEAQRQILARSIEAVLKLPGASDRSVA